MNYQFVDYFICDRTNHDQFYWFNHQNQKYEPCMFPFNNDLMCQYLQSQLDAKQTEIQKLQFELDKTKELVQQYSQDHKTLRNKYDDLMKSYRRLLSQNKTAELPRRHRNTYKKFKVQEEIKPKPANETN